MQNFLKLRFAKTPATCDPDFREPVLSILAGKPAAA
jgi:hypothetical protein